MSTPHLIGANAAFLSALAEMRRAQGLFVAPLTAEKKALLEQRLNDAGRALALCVETLVYVQTEPPFIAPQAEPALPPNVVRMVRP
jgi:hypothetical protein